MNHVNCEKKSGILITTFLISALLSMLHEADPITGEADPPDMPRLEQQVKTFDPAGVYFLVILLIYAPLPPPGHPFNLGTVFSCATTGTLQWAH